MLTVKFIRDNKKFVIERLSVKNYDANKIIDQVINTDEQRKSTQQNLDELLSKLNALSKEIGKLFKEGKIEEANKEMILKH